MIWQITSESLGIKNLGVMYLRKFFEKKDVFITKI